MGRGWTLGTSQAGPERGQGAEGEAAAVMNTLNRAWLGPTLSQPSWSLVTSPGIKRSSLPPTRLLLPPPSLVHKCLYREGTRKPRFSLGLGRLRPGPPLLLSSHREDSQSLLPQEGMGAAEWDTVTHTEQIMSSGDKGAGVKGRSATSPRARAWSQGTPGGGG